MAVILHYPPLIVRTPGGKLLASVVDIVLDPADIARAYSQPQSPADGHVEMSVGLTSQSDRPDGAASGELNKVYEIAGLPQEVATVRAAEILGVSKDTVLKLKAAGLLEYRNTAPPGSSRPVYAFTLRSVMELRTSYERDEPLPRQPPDFPNRRIKGHKKYKHLNLDD